MFPNADCQKGYQFFNTFKLEQNQLFFAKRIVLVEGEQDYIALVAAARKNGWFEYPEEIGVTIVVTSSKSAVPKYQKLLNAFNIKYSVLIEMDGCSRESPDNKKIFDEINDNIYECMPNKLEDIVNHGEHFRDNFDALKYFAEMDHIPAEFEQVAKNLFCIET